MATGDKAEFVLVFEPIPSLVKHFHLSEGPYKPDPGEQTWTVRDIRLQ